jgi:lipopolysaccharide export system permease protein
MSLFNNILRLTILDKYLIKKYLSSFLFTIAMITLIAIAIDFFEKVDRFLEAETTALHILKDYHLNFIPWINGLLWPLFSLVAVIFFTSRLAKDTEFIAMLSAGISYSKIVKPYIISASILAILLWLGNNYVIPNASRIKNEFDSEYLKKSGKTTLESDRHFFISPTQKAYFRIYSESDSSIYNFRLETIKNGKINEVTKADKLNFIADSAQWKMVGYEIRTFDSLRETYVKYDGQEKMMDLPFLPEDFVVYSKQMEMLTSPELQDYIIKEEERGIEPPKKYKIELYRRTADPFTIIILTIIGVCVASRKVRGGLGYHLAVGIILGAIYVVLSKFTMTFALNLSFHPLLGVWVPNFVFSLIAVYLYYKAQK